MKVCVVRHGEISLTETFIRAHIDRLPVETVGIHGIPPRLLGQSAPDAIPFAERVSQAVFRRMGLKRLSNGRGSHQVYLRLLRKIQPDLVLAEYGVTGVQVMDVCHRLHIPLVVHFHGYDASQQSIIDQYGDKYRSLFCKSVAVIAVSQAMRRALVELGAPAEKVFHNPCGVDVQHFGQTRPAQNPPVFLSVGRLVDKKAPHLLIQAFARVYEHHPSARLRIIGDGPLKSVCCDLIIAHGLEEAVTLLGTQSHDVVQREMQHARAFVQHSVVAASGDSEGTPVSVLEAGASGLPVVSTYHAGIPDVVVDRETGLLVEERDVRGMAECMSRLIQAPEDAQRLGAAARKRIEQHFTMEASLERLAAILAGVLGRGECPAVEHPALNLGATASSSSRL